MSKAAREQGPSNQLACTSPQPWIFDAPSLAPRAALALSLAVANLSAHAGVTEFSPNGYSGSGLVPSASTLLPGLAVVGDATFIPGAAPSRGHSQYVGLGLASGLEVVGRLATQDLHCNMFKAGACPPNTIRDFSASLKWSLPLTWLQENNARLALGMNDVGGAAARFTSYYVVASQSWGPLEWRLGHAKPVGDLANLRGTFAALDWQALKPLRLSLQRLDGTSTLHASLQHQLLENGTGAFVTLSRYLEGPRQGNTSQWATWGLQVPLGPLRNDAATSGARTRRNDAVPSIRPAQLPDALVRQGFHNVALGETPGGTLVVQIENTGYTWNAMDALGPALGAVAAAYGQTSRQVDLTLRVRGISFLRVRADVACLKQWLEGGQVCPSLQIDSGLTTAQDMSDVQWTHGTPWSARPELVINPLVASTVGTEYGAFDVDLGANINLLLPLWPGATLDLNQVEPLGLQSADFAKGGAFYASRIQRSTSRKMLHQILSLPGWNTQARISAGTSYKTWDGAQLETQTLSNDGLHRAGLIAGAFKNGASVAVRPEREYKLITYRYSWPLRQPTSTELTAGQFWLGDRGFLATQRFWHGDTSISVYMRQTKMNPQAQKASFAGLQLSIPLTPRQTTGWKHFGVRGSNQWSYSLETRILDTDNRLGSGQGEIPRMGESLQQTFNRDRHSQAYLESQVWRIRDAYRQLYVP